VDDAPAARGQHRAIVAHQPGEAVFAQHRFGVVLGEEGRKDGDQHDAVEFPFRRQQRAREGDDFLARQFTCEGAAQGQPVAAGALRRGEIRAVAEILADDLGLRAARDDPVAVENRHRGNVLLGEDAGIDRALQAQLLAGMLPLVAQQPQQAVGIVDRAARTDDHAARIGIDLLLQLDLAVALVMLEVEQHIAP